MCSSVEHMHGAVSSLKIILTLILIIILGVYIGIKTYILGVQRGKL